MKKKLLSIVLVICMIMSMTQTVLAAEAADTEVANAEVVNTEAADTEVADIEVVDTEVADTEVVDTEVIGTEVLKTEADGTDAVAAPVAKVGNVEYTSLETAIEAAKGGDTVTLLNDLALTGTIVIPQDATVIFDLAGFTITGTPTETSAYAVIHNKGNLTVTGNGTIRCDHKLSGSTSYAVNTILNGGSLTVNSGTIENVTTATSQIGYAIDNNSTSSNVALVINGGTITSSGSNYYDGIRLFCNSETYSNSATVESGSVSSVWLQNPSDSANGRNTRDMKGSVSINGGNIAAMYLEPSTAFEASVTGGTFTGKISYFETAQNRDITGFVKGGTFSDDSVEAYLADGYYLENAANGYTVKELSLNAVNSEAALQAALLQGGEITLTGDIAASGTGFIVTKDTIINLNNCDISVPADTAGDGVFHVTSGKLTINGEGEINGVGENDYNMAIWADGGHVEINGGTYTNVGASGEDDDHFDLIYAKNSGTVTINGGVFKAQTPKWTLNQHDATGGAIIVNGGTFYGGYNPAEVYTETTQPKSFLGEDCYLKVITSEEGDGYTVRPNADFENGHNHIRQ